MVMMYSFIITNTNAQGVCGRNDIDIKNSNVEDINNNYKNSKSKMKAEFKLFKAFNRDYKNDKDVKWFVEPKIISATFTRDDIKNNVVYDSEGRWLRTVKTYNENKLNPVTREIVKSKYAHYEISEVLEIEDGETKCYFIYLEGDSTFKVVKIMDGEVHIYRQYKKQAYKGS